MLYLKSELQIILSTFQSWKKILLSSYQTLQFICLAGFCFILSWIIGQTGRAWIVGIGELSLVGALVTLLVGTIAERKEWQAAHKIDDSK